MHFFKKKCQNRPKNKIPLGKRLFIGITAALVAFATVLIPSDHEVFAASVNVVDYGAYFNGEWESMILYQGTPAYCIQRDTLMPAPYIKTGTQADVYSTLSLDTFGGLSPDVKRKLAAYTYYGYGYSGRGDYSWYFATQEAVWSLFGVGGNYWSGSVSNGDLQNKKNVIINDANNYLNQHATSYSFQIKDENGRVVGTTKLADGKIGKTYTITDTSGQLAKSKLIRNDFGDRLKVNGNTITVTLNDSDYMADRKVEFSYSNSLPQRGRNLFLYSGSYQNVVTLSTPLPVATSGGFSISATGVPVLFDKLDKEGHQIAGAKMSLYRNANGTQTLVESYTTTSEAKKFTLRPGSYTMYETEAPTGYYIADPVTFNVETEYDVTQRFSMTDSPITVLFDKYGKTSGDTVVGAHIQIISNSSGNVVDDFYTSEDKTQLTGSSYKAGESYTIKELSAPPGYYVLEGNGTFQVPSKQPAEKDLTVSIADDEIDYRVLKLDSDTSAPVEGAVMQTLDANGNVIEEWTTDKNEHKLDKSKYSVGSSYRVHEKTAPKGYYTMPEDIQFTISPSVRDTYRIYAYDHAIKTGILKTDENGTPVGGAVLALYDGDTEIDRWETTEEAYSVTGLENGKTYTVKEISAPAGYYKTTTPKQFTVKAGNSAAQDKETIIEFENNKIDYTVSKIDANTKELLSGVEIDVQDENGNTLTTLTTRNDEVAQIPSGILESGKTYTLHESKSIPGYYYANSDVTFTVPETVEEAKKVDKKNFTLTMADSSIKYSVLKVDSSTGETVKDALLELYDDPNAEQALYSWRSSDEPEVLSEHVALEAGKEYYIKEAEAPNGYYLNNDMAKIAVPYTTDRTGTIKVSFYNKPIIWHIVKQDMDGNVLSTVNDTYFTLEVYDTNETTDYADDDALVATLKTNDDNYIANGYFDMASYIKEGLIKGGHHYRIHEVDAANGYLLAEDKIVEISQTGTTDTILSAVNDEKITVHIKKTDENGNLLTTYTTLDGRQEGFEITIYDEETGTEVCKFDTSDSDYIANGYFDASNYLNANRSYVAKETRAPRGFYVAKDYSFTTSSVNELEDKTIVMIDPTLMAQFRKEDSVGNVLTTVNGEGFEFQIIDTTNNEVVGVVNTQDSDLSNGGWIEIGQYLQEAKTYRIHEIYAPSGYAYSTKDAYITTPGYYVESDGSVQNVIVVNDPQ